VYDGRFSAIFFATLRRESADLLIQTFKMDAEL
jgi:hypothetical protein